ncbi:hypothetical protein PENTCL1PPCAC_9035, partial [Pristionchus entomophagus]
ISSSLFFSSLCNSSEDSSKSHTAECTGTIITSSLLLYSSLSIIDPLSIHHRICGFISGLARGRFNSHRLRDDPDVVSVSITQFLGFDHGEIGIGGWPVREVSVRLGRGSHVRN